MLCLHGRWAGLLACHVNIPDAQLLCTCCSSHAAQGSHPFSMHACNQQKSMWTGCICLQESPVKASVLIQPKTQQEEGSDRQQHRKQWGCHGQDDTRKQVDSESALEAYITLKCFLILVYKLQHPSLTRPETDWDFSNATGFVDRMS